MNIEDRVEKIPEAGCWLWMGYVSRKGYGQTHLNGRAISAHRAAYELLTGPIPVGMHVLHRCDVPCCVNPAHLFTGTPADNSADMVRKGRNKWKRTRPSGLTYQRRSPTAYESSRALSLQERAEVLEIYAAGLSQQEIANAYGVAQMTISKYVRSAKC